MITHQDIAENFPAVALTGFAEQLKKITPICIVPINQHSTLPPRHHMIDRPLKFDS